MGRREGGPPAGPGGGWGASAPDRPSGWETQDPLSPTRRTAVPGGENTESRPPRKPRLCPDGTGMRTCRGSPPRVSKGAGRWGRPQEWYRGQAPHIPRGAPLCVGSPLAVAEVMEGSSPASCSGTRGPCGLTHPPEPRTPALREPSCGRGGREAGKVPPQPSPAPSSSPRLPLRQSLWKPRTQEERAAREHLGGQLPGARAAPPPAPRTPRALTPAGGRPHARAPSGDRPQAPGAWAFGPHG